MAAFRGSHKRRHTNIANTQVAGMTAFGGCLIEMLVLHGTYDSHVHNAIMSVIIQITRFSINHA